MPKEAINLTHIKSALVFNQYNTFKNRICGSWPLGSPILDSSDFATNNIFWELSKILEHMFGKMGTFRMQLC